MSDRKRWSSAACVGAVSAGRDREITDSLPLAVAPCSSKVRAQRPSQRSNLFHTKRGRSTHFWSRCQQRRAGSSLVDSGTHSSNCCHDTLSSEGWHPGCSKAAAEQLSSATRHRERTADSCGRCFAARLRASSEASGSYCAHTEAQPRQDLGSHAGPRPQLPDED